MTSDLQRRLEALSGRINADRPAGTLPGSFQAVVIFGVLPPGEPLFAVAGLHEWIRDFPAESLDQFVDRAVTGARELKEPRVVIGGLPNSQAQMDVASVAYDIWAASDSGVPDPEPSRGMPSPVQRAIGLSPV